MAPGAGGGPRRRHGRADGRLTGRETARETCARLRARVEAALRPRVPRGTRVALVGTGLANVGDCAIAVATREWLARAVGGPWLELDRRTYDGAVLGRWLGDDGILLLAGGGTVGDVWPSQEDLRRRAIEDAAGRRAVQLPQTIHFRSEARLAEARAFYGGRPGLTLLLRDEKSLAIAQGWGTAAELVPDMAFLLDLRPDRPPSRDAVWLLRADQESARAPSEGALPPAPLPEAEDWPPPRARVRRTLRKLLSQTLGEGAAASRRRAWIAAMDAATARTRTREGVALLSRGRTVATDRLHGSLLSLLLGIPVAVVADRHGKLRAYHSAWTAECEAVAWCGSVDEARAAVVRLVASGAARP